MAPPIDDILSKPYDYVIIGGGTSGLVLAHRLSSDPSRSVIVLEAGEAHEDGDPNIAIPGQFGIHFGNPKYDWGFETVPQKYADNKRFKWSRGKGLGGSSAINFQCWIAPPLQDMDAIEALGNPGWNWDQYAKYRTRAYEQLKTTLPRRSEALDDLFRDTLLKMEFERNEDPYNGNNAGHFLALASIDPKTWRRSYIAASYYSSSKDRPNLTVITEAVAARALFDDSTYGHLIAIGAEFLYDGQTRIVRSNKEVIICAGALKSPQILELSGIGRRDILEKIGIEVKIELPGVGENVQEHMMIPAVYEIAPDKSYETLDLMKNPDYVAEGMKRYEEGRGMPSVGITSFAYLPLLAVNPESAPAIIEKVENRVEELKKSGSLAPGLAEQYDIQLRKLRNPDIPDCEVVMIPGYYSTKGSPEDGKAYISFEHIANHTFSRGSIHAKSSDPTEHPEMDPHYFEMDYDIELLVQHVEFGRQIAALEPFKSAVALEVCPGPEYTGDQLRAYIREYMSTSWHTVGSCSMLPRDKNGVVSPELVVYGTKNLRIADISIVPLTPATHTQSVAYAIGEKASDIICGL